MSNTTTKTSGKAPTHIAYHVKEGNQKSYFTRIGAAFAHKDGKGFNILLECVPLNGNITLRTPSESE